MSSARATAHHWLFRPFVLSVVVAGFGAAALSLRHLAAHPVDLFWHDGMPGLVGLTVMLMLTGRFSIKVPGHAARVSVSEVFAFLIAFHLGAAAAVVALFADGLCGALRQKTRTLHRLLFNTAEPALSIGVASVLASHLPATFDTASAGANFIGSISALVVTYFLMNTGLTAFAVAMESGASALQVWRSHALYTGANYVAAAAVAGLTVDPVDGIDARVVWIAVPMFGLSYLVLRNAARMVAQAERHVHDLDERYLSTIEALAIAVEVRDDVTHEHVRRVQQYSDALARALGLTDPLLLKALDAAGLLHDVGKITVPDRVLQKPGKLSAREFETMKQHADRGARIVELVRFPYPVARIVRHHHERWDGRGYPDGLAGREIPIGARILTVVDCFDALTSDRPYRRSLSDADAMALIARERGTHFDPEVVDAFLPLVPELRKINVVGLTPTGVHASAPAPIPPGRLDAAVRDTRARFEARAAGTFQQLWRLRPDADACCYVLDNAHDRLVPACMTAGLKDTGVVGPLGLDTSLSGWVAGNRHTIENSDPRLDLGDVAGTLGFLQAASLPVFDAGTLTGVFAVYARGAERFSERDIAALWQLAQAMTLAEPLGAVQPEAAPFELTAQQAF